MHYKLNEALIDGVAQRMNPEKYSWSKEGKVELQNAAINLLAYIEGFSLATLVHENLSEAKDKAGRITFGAGELKNQSNVGDIRFLNDNDPRPDRPYNMPSGGVLKTS